MSELTAKYISTLELSHEEWLEERRKGLGGSDIGAVLGLNKFSTPRKIYFDKIGEGKEEPDTKRLKAGRYAEPTIAAWYTDETNYRVVKDNKIRIHPEYPFLRGNIDRIATLPDGTRRIVEIKNTAIWAYSNWGTEIPLPYFCQVQLYMGITNFETADFAILKDGWNFEIYTVKRDDEFLELIYPKLQDFWENHVLARVPPEPINTEEIKSLYAKHINGKVAEADEELYETAKQLRQVKDEIKDKEKLEEILTVKLQNTMLDSEALIKDGEILATWKAGKESMIIDSARLKEEKPDIYSEYLKPKKASRTFLLKI